MEPIAALLEFGNCGKEGLDLDFARGDRFDGFGVFAGRGAAAEDAQLAGDEELEREGDLGLEVADAADAAALAH